MPDTVGINFTDTFNSIFKDFTPPDINKDVTSYINLAVPKTGDFTSKFNNSTFGKNFGLWNAGLNMANTLFTGIAGEKDEYSGKKGSITSGMDSAYDSIMGAVGMIPGWGQVAQLAMGANKLLGNVANKLGGGTSGMCVCAGTKVYTASGKLVNIEDLKLEEGIIGWSEITKEIKPLTINHLIEPRLKECLLITLENGEILKCSVDHPILSDTSPKAKMKIINGKRIGIRLWEFRRADELKVGNFVGIANNVDYWGDKKLLNAYLIGLLIGDGSYGRGQSCRIISVDPDIWKYIEDNHLGVINHCDDKRPEKYSKEIRTYRIIGGMDLLRSVGIIYLVGKLKTLPKDIWLYDRESICSLIAGFYDTDGSISVNENKLLYSITLYLSNKELLNEVKQLLYKLGINSAIGIRKAATYKIGGRLANSLESYRLEIHDISSVRKFYQLIPLNIGYKKENLYRIVLMLLSKLPKEHNDISGAKQVKIKNIENIGVLTVYNLLADNDHTYLANNIITHNTTQDAVLGSSFLLLTPLGLINGFFGNTADTITKDNQLFALIGSSYGGTSQTVDDALLLSGKKYGLFSKGALKDANEEIAEASRLLFIMSNIADEASDRFAIQDSMSAINGNRRKYNMQGGYNQSNIRVGKLGMLIDLVNKVRDILYNKSTEIKLNTPKYKNGGSTEILLITPKYKEGGQINKKSRTLLELIEYAKKENPRFVLRMSEPFKYIEWDDDKGHHFGTHEMSYGEADGRYFVYPKIQEIDGNLVRYLNDQEAMLNALKNHNILWVNNEDEAKMFTESEELPDGTFSGYKAGWPDFFKLKPVKYQEGGSISLRVRDYYKGYNLNGVTVVNDNSSRTEGSTIYSPSDEFTVHELWHYLSLNKPNESLKEFYDSLDDSKLKLFGADLDFVKRTGDPSDFYNPSELEARLKAAKFMSLGLNYTKDFFKNLRSNETLYGDNMRDLLRMFNDNYLEKLFNLDSALKFLLGGSINVIPEGALHARKHNMDMEGITKKGIPVVDNKGEQQAEIERSELILRKSVTEVIEKLYKEYYKDNISNKEQDELALKAGKLLVDEILYNTIDNTNELI